MPDPSAAATKSRLLKKLIVKVPFLIIDFILDVGVNYSNRTPSLVALPCIGRRVREPG